MEHNVFSENRRNFLTKVVPLAALGCLGCKRSFAYQLVDDLKSNVSEGLEMSAEEVYTFFYGMFIPLLKSLENSIGSIKFNDLITKTSTENLEKMVSSATKDIQEKDLKAFASFMNSALASPPNNSAFKYEITEQSDKVLELKYTQCLPARLLRAMNVIDIGLAIECSGAKAAAKGFNPKIGCSNPKNMMKGDSYCIERFTLNT